jgi:hypothetical protein
MQDHCFANIAGIAGVLTVVCGLVMQLSLGYPGLNRFRQDVGSPVLALELSENAEDIAAVVHGTGVKRWNAIESLRSNNRLDLAFIPIYSLFLWSLARLFHPRPRLISLLIVGTAIFDYIEDWKIARVLDGQNSPPYVASLIKWGLFGLVLLATGLIVIRSACSLYSVATKHLIGLAYFISALLLLIPVAQRVAFQYEDYSLIEPAVEIFSFLVVIQSIGFLGPYLAIRPIIPEYIDNFCEERRKPGRDTLTAINPQRR